MSTAVMALVATEHVTDLGRVAEERRVVSSSSALVRVPRIELRRADAHDADAVRRLAALDSAPELEGEVLLALIDGEPVAGLSLRDRRVAANPFVPTGEAVALLRLRADHLSADRTPRRLRRIPRLRLA